MFPTTAEGRKCCFPRLFPRCKTACDYLLFGLTWLGDYDVAISHGSRLVKISQYKLVVKAVDSSTTPDVPKIYGVTVRRMDEEEELVEHKSPQQSPEIQQILDEYADCFVEENPLGVIQDTVHRIDTKDDIPVTSRPYRMSWQEQRHLKVELDQLLGAGRSDHRTAFGPLRCCLWGKKGRKSPILCRL